ncbi:hypothetical protein BJ878DRAFT_192428 [Calycina marina]|uniref:Uncharacterized protein n=1 Tax=Calycina marina TaxID=1763456 RepID=A0A9P7YY15_9HELO|nr:hypothetical protein BJ878DRAFT_192428 [Calycina marina]
MLYQYPNQPARLCRHREECCCFDFLLRPYYSCQSTLKWATPLFLTLLELMEIFPPRNYSYNYSSPHPTTAKRDTTSLASSPTTNMLFRSSKVQSKVIDVETPTILLFGMSKSLYRSLSPEFPRTVSASSPISSNAKEISGKDSEQRHDSLSLEGYEWQTNGFEDQLCELPDNGSSETCGQRVDRQRLHRTKYHRYILMTSMLLAIYILLAVSCGVLRCSLLHSLASGMLD